MLFNAPVSVLEGFVAPMQKAPITIFAYGTLLDAAVQDRIVGRRVAGRADVLPGYRQTRVTIAGQQYPNVIQDSESAVSGQLFEITEEELERIDAYETDAYHRFQAQLASGKRAWVWQA